MILERLCFAKKQKIANNMNAMYVRGQYVIEVCVGVWIIVRERGRS